MPELPEVETTCASLKNRIISKKIASVFISGKNLRLPFPQNFADEIKNQQIISIVRRARYILIEITSGKIILIHLGMSGKLIYQNEIPKKPAIHDHCIIKFNDDGALIYNDPRRFGLIDLVIKEKINNHKMIKNLGPEPLSKKFDAKYLQDQLQGKKINIKTAMMDNKIVVGVGNIYINESLFESSISPLRSAGDLKSSELKILTKNIKKILKKAIELGGSTLRDYVDLNGNPGGFQFDFKVYGRDNKKCFNCNETIKKIKQNGRSSFFCSLCQLTK